MNIRKDTFLEDLTPTVINSLDKLLTMQIEHINKGLRSVNIKIGKYYIENALRTFQKIQLVNIYGADVPDVNGEFRYFVLGLIDGVDDKYKRMAFNEIILPAVKNGTDIELVEIIKKQYCELIDVQEEPIEYVEVENQSVPQQYSLLTKFLNLFRKDKQC